MRGHAHQVRPGVWRAWIDLPRTAEEPQKRRQKCVTIYATGQRDADKQLAKLITEACAGNIAGPTKQTIESYLKGWLEKRATEVSPKTLETWDNLTRAYIAPHIGTVVLEKLTPKHVDDLYSKLRTAGRRHSTGGLSPRSILHVHRLLSEAMKAAVRLQLIPRNPCDGLGPKGVIHNEREKVRDFDEDCVRRLLDAVEGHWLKLPILLAATMGMRRGECLALTWDDIDFTVGTLNVCRSLQHLRGASPTVKRPKRERSRRPTMPAFLIDALRRHKGTQAAHRLRIGEVWEDNGLVIANEFGQVRSPGSLTHAFSDLIDKTGLPDITFHDLRHVNATLLLLAGVSDKVVSGRLGHTDTRITRDLYQHVLPQMDQVAADKTDEFFRRVVGG